MKRFLLPLLLLLTAVAASAGGSVMKTTMPYAVKDGDTLRIDRYTVRPTDYSARPAIVFAFGGGFKGGVRDNAEYMPFFTFFAEQGYDVFSIDYRTGLSNADPSSLASPEAFAGALMGAIDMAVEDLYDATAYIVRHHVDLNIDPEHIIISGSSAGAITVLQAEYYCCVGYPLTARLPEGFRYAGVVSYAGAILSPGAPQWPSTPCPIMMFHGNADGQVPFATAEIPGIGGLYGSQTIADSLKPTGATYSLFVIDNAGHEIAVDGMTDGRWYTQAFLQAQVMKHIPAQIVTFSSDPTRRPVEKTFSLLDYIRNNM